MALPAFAAKELNFRKKVGNFWVYLAVMPADFLAGPRAAEPGATPFQPASARDTHHLMVSLFDYRAGGRITEAAVEARVAALGFSGVKKALENTSAAGGARLRGPVSNVRPRSFQDRRGIPHSGRDGSAARHVLLYASELSTAEAGTRPLPMMFRPRSAYAPIGRAR